jgi:hypothetical protein|tara:strand:+ start:196 stop:603 length:408 start_codon:yes stop_codon:yes gene_type:complete
MATVNATLQLASTDLLSDALNTSVVANIANMDVTSGMARKKVTSTAKGTSAGQVAVYTADDFGSTYPAYIYVKNTNSTRTNYIYIYCDTASDDPVIFKLAGGEWAFVPIPSGENFKAYSTAGTEILEFMTFGASS